MQREKSTRDYTGKSATERTPSQPQHPRKPKQCVDPATLDNVPAVHDLSGSDHLLLARRATRRHTYPYATTPHLDLVTKKRRRISENPVKAVPSNRSILPPHAWKALAASLHISNRELQIIQGIFDDQKELTIAAELTILVHTVHTHLARLYRKLGVCTRVGLILCILAEYLSSL